MPYATPQNLLDWFDAQELAQLATPKRYPVIDAVLLELTVSGGDRSAYTAQEIEAADAALASIAGALDASDAIIDSYVGKRYQLPLSQTQIDASPLPRYSGDLARYQLTDDQEVETITKRYDRALRWLRDLANGSASIGEGEPEQTSGAVVISGPTRIFGRDRMKGL